MLRMFGRLGAVVALTLGACGGDAGDLAADTAAGLPEADVDAAIGDTSAAPDAIEDAVSTPDTASPAPPDAADDATDTRVRPEIGSRPQRAPPMRSRRSAAMQRPSWKWMTRLPTRPSDCT